MVDVEGRRLALVRALVLGWGGVSISPYQPSMVDQDDPGKGASSSCGGCVVSFVIGALVFVGLAVYEYLDFSEGVEKIAAAAALADEVKGYVIAPCASWLAYHQERLPGSAPYEDLLEANTVRLGFRYLPAIPDAVSGMTRSSRLRFYEREKRDCIQREARWHSLPLP